ncbi:MAG: sigma-54-dependent transcriptional regulator [Syntrophomonadaceae bacterium]
MRAGARNLTTRQTILLVGQGADARSGIEMVLTADGYDVLSVDTCRAALDRLRSARPAAVVTDARLPDGNALDLLSRIRDEGLDVSFIVLAETIDLNIAIQALQDGADQFLIRPVNRLALLLVLQRAIENRLNRRRERQREAVRHREPADPFLGQSPAMRELKEKARRVLDSDRPVLIQGETGSGKGVLAAWLHAHGPRGEEAFLDLNCAGLTRELLETELFGHEKGAFTGAVAAKAGLFESADGGTLFLDEIGDVDPQVQPKLLKVLEEGRFRRLGEVRDRHARVWLIAATHQDLGKLVEENRFRRDLYFRISTIPLRLPSLRQRIEDIPALAEQFLRRIAGELGRRPPSLSASALRRLQAHDWPGNVRELRNVLERAVLLCEAAVLEAQDLGFDPIARAVPVTSGLTTLREAERSLIEKALGEERGNVGRAAERLGISRSSLYQRILRHRISVSRM